MYAVLAVTYYFIDFFLSLLVATRLARRRLIGGALVHRGFNGLLTFSVLQFDNGSTYGDLRSPKFVRQNWTKEPAGCTSRVATRKVKVV